MEDANLSYPREHFITVEDKLGQQIKLQINLPTSSS